MPLPVVYHEDIIGDREYKLVSPGILQTAVRRIKDDPTCGKPLTGDLKGCRSVRVGGVENRLVYEIVGEGTTAAYIRILAVGRRRDSAAYDSAVSRR